MHPLQPKLIQFLRSAADQPFEWGQNDCSLFLADWACAVTGKDPAKSLRGTYDGLDAKDALVFANRGLQRLVAGIAIAAGCRRTSAPDVGDVGLIALNRKPYGAICTGRLAGKTCWASRGVRGVTFLTHPRVLQAWSFYDVDGKLGQYLAPPG